MSGCASSGVRTPTTLPALPRQRAPPLAHEHVAAVHAAWLEFWTTLCHSPCAWDSAPCLCHAAVLCSYKVRSIYLVYISMHLRTRYQIVRKLKGRSDIDVNTQIILTFPDRVQKYIFFTRITSFQLMLPSRRDTLPAASSPDDRYPPSSRWHLVWWPRACPRVTDFLPPGFAFFPRNNLFPLFFS